MTEEVSFKIKCARIAANVLNLLGEKNTQYGDSAFDPIRMFSKLGPDAGLRVRIDDKLSRLLRGNADMESDTDVIDDLIGYFILLLLSLLRISLGYHQRHKRKWTTTNRKIFVKAVS
jgi:hypothetical protein